MDDAASRRASQFCRILGNPLAYRIVRLLEGKRRRPSEMARALGATAPAVVNQLKHLKIAGVVLYESRGTRRAGRRVEYWLADPDLGRVMDTLERRVAALR